MICNAGWSLRWDHWPEGELLLRIFWTRSDAIDWALETFYTEETREHESRSALWARQGWVEE